MAEYTPVLEFWLDGAEADPAAAARRWFAGGEAVDAALRERFGDQVDAAVAGDFEHWPASAPGRLALILLLDQFTRNLFRGTARAYAGDKRARRLTHDGLAAGVHHELGAFERAFFLMPLEHSEDPADQDASVAGFEALAAEAPPALRPVLESFLGHAREHRDIVQRFGRFPQRNERLGRASTDAERAYLADAPRFGQ